MSSDMKTLRGYHFVSKTLRDGRPVPEDGVWLKHKGKVEPCASGFHMSEHPFDALRYAPGETLCLVELRGNLQPHGDPIDKWVGRERRILKRIDATHLLRRFAADRALSVKHLWDMPPIVERYLTTLDEELREEAEIVARGAVREARAAVGAAARRAAWDATRETVTMIKTAAWNAAWEAIEAVALNAGKGMAIWDEAGKTTRAEFKRRVEEAFGL